MAEFNRPLGRPLGPPLKNGDTFTRHFEHLSVMVNIATEETTYVWDGSSSISLPAPPPASLPSPTNPQPAPTSPTNPPITSSVTRINIGSAVFQPIASASTCPAEGVASIVIDGTGYTGGPSTIRIYDCTFIDANYDFSKFSLENFQEGLSFELGLNTDSIDLVITSLYTATYNLGST